MPPRQACFAAITNDATISRIAMTRIAAGHWSVANAHGLSSDQVTNGWPKKKLLMQSSIPLPRHLVAEMSRAEVVFETARTFGMKLANASAARSEVDREERPQVRGAGSRRDGLVEHEPGEDRHVQQGRARGSRW